MYRGNRWHMVWFKENHEIWRICRSPILFPKPLALSCEISLKGPKAWQLHRNVARLPGFSPAFLGLGHQPLPVKLNWKLSRKPQPRPWIHIHFTTPRHCEEMWITFPNYSCFKYLPSQTKSNAQSSARVHYKLHYSTGCPILSSLVAAASALRRDQGLGPFLKTCRYHLTHHCWSIPISYWCIGETWQFVAGYEILVKMWCSLQQQPFWAATCRLKYRSPQT
jgi:hypothetical protein